MLKKTFLIALFVVGAVAALLISALPQPEEQISANTGSQDGNDIALINARLIDGAAYSGPMTIIVRGGMVEKVTNGTASLEGLQVHDMAGKVVLPGLIDAHTHVYGDALKDSARFGVTTSLDMFSANTTIKETRRQRTSTETRDQADLFTAGMLATVAGGHGTQFPLPVETLSSPEEADAWVARRLQEGSDYIKLVYMPYQNRIPSLDLATAVALIKAAKAQGVLALAHISSLKGAEDMVEAGIDGLVHIFADQVTTPELAAMMAARDVFVVPTLSVIGSVDGHHSAEHLMKDKQLQSHLSQEQSLNLKSKFGGKIPGFNLAIALENVRLLKEAGVDVLAGSDAPNPGTAHGISLHGELELLVKAGFTSAEAIKAVTALPARRFGLADRGRIAPGVRADFLVLNEDPLTDIQATHAIERVYKNGFQVERQIGSAGAVAAAVLPPQLSYFDTKLAGPDELVWTTTSDRLAGGKSDATLSISEEGAALVVGTVSKGFAYPWAGAFLPFSPDLSVARSFGNYQQIRFEVRGTPGEYGFVAFNRGSAGIPPTQRFEVTENWRTVALDIDAFKGLERGAVSGIAVTAGPATGTYRFELRAIKLQ